MAKLNKQEVNAIAGKLHRELEKVAKESRENAMRSYTPSESYTAIKDLLTQRDELNRQIAALKEQRDSIVNNAEIKLHEIHNIWWKAENASVDEVCNLIVGKECQLKAVPSIDELKEDVTIAAIDDSFNTSSFIEEQLAKFQ